MAWVGLVGTMKSSEKQLHCPPKKRRCVHEGSGGFPAIHGQGVVLGLVRGPHGYTYFGCHQARPLQNLSSFRDLKLIAHLKREVKVMFHGGS